jgi:hypothetical protein
MRPFSPTLTGVVSLTLRQLTEVLLLQLAPSLQMVLLGTTTISLMEQQEMLVTTLHFLLLELLDGKLLP